MLSHRYKLLLCACRGDRRQAERLLSLETMQCPITFDQAAVRALERRARYRR